MLGWPLKVTVSGITGYDWKFYWSGRTDLKPQPVPPELDYDMWLGPAPYKPYNPQRVHANFRGYWDYDGGGLGDMGQHYLDPVQYLLGKDDTSPIRVDVDAPQQHYDAAGSWRRIEFTYADGCKIILDGENRDTEAAYIDRPEGEDLPRLPVGHPESPGTDRHAAGPRASDRDVLRLGAIAPEVRAQRIERPPVVHDGQPRGHRRPAGPDAPLRPDRATVRERRGGEPADQPADARAMGAVSDVTRTSR